MTQSLQMAGVSQRVDHAWQTCKVWSISFFKILQTTCLKTHRAQDMLKNTVTWNWGQKDIAFEWRCNKLSYLSHFLCILAFISADALCCDLWSLMGYPVSPNWCTMSASVISPPGSRSIFAYSIFMYIGNLSGWFSSLSQKSLCLLLIKIIINYNDQDEGH